MIINYVYIISIPLIPEATCILSVPIALLDVSLYMSAIIVSLLTAATLGIGVVLGGARNTLITHFQLI